MPKPAPHIKLSPFQAPFALMVFTDCVPAVFERKYFPRLLFSTDTAAEREKVFPFSTTWCTPYSQASNQGYNKIPVLS
jgi:hypothetical protein